MDWFNSAPAKRAQRNAIFGLSSSDPDGLWVYLGLYKANARLHLNRYAPKILAKSLGSTTPVIGQVTPGAYLTILDRFLEHWVLVNAALPADKPLVVGPLAARDLKTKRGELATLIEGIDETVLTRLAVMRAEREELFGDVREDERESDSILAYLLAYETEIATEFAGTPLSATLPRIFPDETAGEVRFDFNFNFKQTGATVTVWFELPAAPSASVVYLKEGAFEETVALTTAQPFKVSFQDVTVQEDVDEVELRDAAGKTVAYGRLNRALLEPLS